MSKNLSTEEVLENSLPAGGAARAMHIAEENMHASAKKTVKFSAEVTVKEVERYLSQVSLEDEEEHKEDASLAAKADKVNVIKIIVSRDIIGNYDFEFVDEVEYDDNIILHIQKILDEQESKEVDLLGDEASKEFLIIFGV